MIRKHREGLLSVPSLAPNLPDNHAMMLTVPFVMYGVFRYIYLIPTRNLGEKPKDILITDAPLLASIVAWLEAARSILTIFRGRPVPATLAEITANAGPIKSSHQAALGVTRGPTR